MESYGFASNIEVEGDCPHLIRKSWLPSVTIAMVTFDISSRSLRVP